MLRFALLLSLFPIGPAAVSTPPPSGNATGSTELGAAGGTNGSLVGALGPEGPTAIFTPSPGEKATGPLEVGVGGTKGPVQPGGPNGGTVPASRNEGLVCSCVAKVCKCSPTSNQSPSLPVEKPPSGTEGPAPGGTTPAGNATRVRTYVVCVKRGNSSSTPVSDYLTADKGKSVKIYGRWDLYKCKWGIIEPFVIQESEYNGLLNQCKAKGYRFPQPSDDQHTASYPFQFEGTITDFYRHRTPFMFNHIPKFPADRCTDERKRRRNRRIQRIH